MATIELEPIVEVPVALMKLTMAVKEAAAWLDKVSPGWHRDVNPDTLLMSLPGQCVLGQTGTWDRFLDLKWSLPACTAAFSSDQSLVPLWAQEIEARRT